jgi:nuclear GTP-binding protein
MPLLKSRKEMRKSEGIVKLSAGIVNTRDIILEAPWIPASHPDASEDEDLEQVPDVDIVDVEDEEDEDEDEGEDEDEDEVSDEDEDDAGEDEDSDHENENELNKTSALLTGKRKRPSKSKKSTRISPHPSKQVSFGSQSRSQQVPSVPLKSALKNKTTSVPVHKKIKSIEATNRNPKKAQKGAHPATDGEQDYDFAKFF